MRPAISATRSPKHRNKGVEIKRPMRFLDCFTGRVGVIRRARARGASAQARDQSALADVERTLDRPDGVGDGRRLCRLGREQHGARRGAVGVGADVAFGAADRGCGRAPGRGVRNGRPDHHVANDATAHGRWHGVFGILFILGFPMVAALFAITTVKGRIAAVAMSSSGRPFSVWVAFVALHRIGYALATCRAKTRTGDADRDSQPDLCCGVCGLDCRDRACSLVYRGMISPTPASFPTHETS